jgi:phage-related protein
LKDWWIENKDEIMPLVEALGQVLKWLLIIVAVIVGVFIIVVGGSLVIAVLAAVGAFMALIEFIKKVKTWFGILYDILSFIPTKLAELGEAIKKWFTGDGTKEAAKSFGSNIVTAVVDGIKSKMGVLSAAMSGVAGMIGSFMQHSPAKQGPLSGKGYTFFSGQSVASALAQGMLSQLSAVQNASNQLALATMTGASGSSGFMPPVGFAAGMPASTNSNARGPVNITIHTNEIDPRTTAAELGWELDGRLG